MIFVSNWGYVGNGSCYIIGHVLHSNGSQLRLLSYIPNVIILMFVLRARGGACFDGGGGEKDGGGGEWDDNDGGGWVYVVLCSLVAPYTDFALVIFVFADFIADRVFLRKN